MIRLLRTTGQDRRWSILRKRRQKTQGKRENCDSNWRMKVGTKMHSLGNICRRLSIRCRKNCKEFCNITETNHNQAQFRPSRLSIRSTFHHCELVELLRLETDASMICSLPYSTLEAQNFTTIRNCRKGKSRKDWIPNINRFRLWHTNFRRAVSSGPARSQEAMVGEGTCVDDLAIATSMSNSSCKNFDTLDEKLARGLTNILNANFSK